MFDCSSSPRLESEPEVDPFSVVMESGRITCDEEVAERTGVTIRTVNRIMIVKIADLILNIISLHLWGCVSTCSIIVIETDAIVAKSMPVDRPYVKLVSSSLSDKNILAGVRMQKIANLYPCKLQICRRSLGCRTVEKRDQPPVAREPPIDCRMASFLLLFRFLSRLATIPCNIPMVECPC